MVPKTYRDPGSETLATFELASLSGALAAGAAGVSDPSLLLYPAYCLANGGLAVLIYYRRRLLASQQRISAPAPDRVVRAKYPCPDPSCNAVRQSSRIAHEYRTRAAFRG
jgi:hypothetical protein